MTHQSVGVTTTVTRAQESWSYIYIFLGFALTIEGNIVQMLLSGRWAVLAYLATGATTTWLFLDNARMQNLLIGMKLRYETKGR